MSLDVDLADRFGRELYSANITHNLGKMAEAAGIYEHLWHPEQLGIHKAAALIEPLKMGLDALVADPVKFERYNSPNSWGLYRHFVPFVRDYLEALQRHPGAIVTTST